MSEKIRQCIDNCLDCSSIWSETIMHCLQMGIEHAEPEHIRLLIDCAEICQTRSNFMPHHSTLHGQVCGVCAEVCERCTEDCARFTEDSAMQQCAEVCRKCAASCH